jgi:hypothetical protein
VTRPQIDTTLIRARLFWADGRPSAAAGDAIGALCDALDEAEAALARVRALHSLVRWYDECMTAGPDGGRYATLGGYCLVKPEDHFAVGDEGLWTCPPRRMQDCCVECSENHEEGVIWPCAPVRALDGEVTP